MSTNSSGPDRLGASVARHDQDQAGLRSSSSSHSGATEAKRIPVRIIVADSEAIFRVGMGKIFAVERDLEVVAQTETLQQTMGAVTDTPADVVLFEAGL